METKRLYLRPFQNGDATAMFEAWTQDARVAKYCRWHPHTSIDMTEKLLDIYMDTTNPCYPYRNAITLKETGALIGVIDVVEISSDGHTAEIGYLLAYPYWNMGYMSEALEAMIAHLFHCGFEKVVARHHIDNHASGKVMEKCGMTFMGTEKTEGKFGSDELIQVKCYQISRV